MSPQKSFGRRAVRVNKLRLAIVFAIFFGVVGCVKPADTARTRASNEFPCGKEQLDVKELTQTSFKVSGCGKMATYTCFPEGEIFICMLEGIVESVDTE